MSRKSILSIIAIVGLIAITGLSLFLSNTNRLSQKNLTNSQAAEICSAPSGTLATSGIIPKRGIGSEGFTYDFDLGKELFDINEIQAKIFTTASPNNIAYKLLVGSAASNLEIVNQSNTSSNCISNPYNPVLQKIRYVRLVVPFTVYNAEINIYKKKLTPITWLNTMDTTCTFYDKKNINSADTNCALNKPHWKLHLWTEKSFNPEDTCPLSKWNIVDPASSIFVQWEQDANGKPMIHFNHDFITKTHPCGPGVYNWNVMRPSNGFSEFGPFSFPSPKQLLVKFKVKYNAPQQQTRILLSFGGIWPVNGISRANTLEIGLNAEDIDAWGDAAPNDPLYIAGFHRHPFGQNENWTWSYIDGRFYDIKIEKNKDTEVFVNLGAIIDDLIVRKNPQGQTGFYLDKPDSESQMVTDVVDLGLETLNGEPLQTDLYIKDFEILSNGPVPHPNYVVADWDGNTISTPALYKNGSWAIKPQNTQNSLIEEEIRYGTFGDQGISCDWDGDGKDTITVVRKENNSNLLTWYIKNTNATGVGDTSLSFGEKNDVPVCGDWDGDGKDSVGVYRPSENRWLLKNSNTGDSADINVIYGTSGDNPVVGDWDGNGKSSIGVARKELGVLKWYLTNNITNPNAEVTSTYGLSTDTAISGDWNGDGKDSPGVIREGMIYLANSFNTVNADINYYFSHVPQSTAQIPVPTAPMISTIIPSPTTTVVRPTSAPTLLPTKIPTQMSCLAVGNFCVTNTQCCSTRCIASRCR